MFMGLFLFSMMIVAGIAVSSLMTGCATTTGGATTAGGSTTSTVDETAKTEQPTQQDTVMSEQMTREFLIALSTGNEHHKNKNYVDAIAPLKKAAVMDKEHKYPSTYTKLADSYLKLDKPDSALVVYQEALQIYPDNAFFYRSAGYYLSALQRVPEAIEAYQNAIKYDGQTTTDYKNLGPLLMSENRAEEALENYQKLAELDPGDAQTQEIIASLLAQLGYDAEEIIEQKKKALEANPEDATLMFEIAEMLFKEQQYAESVDYFDKFLAISPDDATALEYKGSALQNDDKFSEAIKSYEKVLALQPDNVKVICEMATCHLELGNLQRAMSVSQQAINKNPNFGLGYIVKGDVYARTADECISKRDKRIVNFDDKLVYEKAYAFYQLGASKDVQYADLGKRKMNYIKTDTPTTEDRFMHPNQKQPAIECYAWLPW